MSSDSDSEGDDVYSQGLQNSRIDKHELYKKVEDDLRKTKEQRENLQIKMAKIPLKDCCNGGDFLTGNDACSSADDEFSAG